VDEVPLHVLLAFFNEWTKNRFIFETLPEMDEEPLHLFGLWTALT